MRSFDHDVVIVGGGPTGMMLGAELALAGIDVAILERRSDQYLAGSRAGGLHARTLEVFDQRGIAERFLAAGTPAQVVGFNMVRLDISDFPTRYPYGLGLWQNQIEAIMADWIAELPVTIHRGREVTGIAPDADSADVLLADGTTLRACYVVGCDGGRSVVRKSAGIGFPGWDATMSWLIAEVETASEPKLGMFEDETGSHGIGKTGKGETVRIVLTEPEVGSGEPTLDGVKAALVRIYGSDFGIHAPTWVSRFTDMTRQAERYRAGRVLLAGDAAHIHPPMGGQGLNIGVQDAVNLGWKLAAVLRGTSPETLLDTYHAERHPIAARVLRNTMAQVALRRRDERTKALGDIFAELVVLDEPRKRFAAEMSGLGVHYDLGGTHPLIGGRMPDLDIETPNGPARVFSFLHKAQPLLLNFGTRGAIDPGPWSDRVQLVEAQYSGVWDIPAIGTVTSPSAVLIRPDGYVAWVSEGSGEGLADALEHWFGVA